MIVGTQKPIDEIWNMVKDKKKVLVFGCNTCVAICHAGGEKEAETIASLLRMKASQEGKQMEVGTAASWRGFRILDQSGSTGSPQIRNRA